MNKKKIQEVFNKYFIQNINILENSNKASLRSKNFVFRGIPGQGDIESSASFRLREGGLVKQTDFIRYHTDLIQSKQSIHESSKSNLSDIETLAEIQHYGGATCLIDFSYNYLIALYFSAEKNNSDDGKVFAIDLYDPINEKIIPLNKKYKNESIENILQKRERNNGRLRIWIWRPYSLNNRILKQDSVFLFSLAKIDKGTNLNYHEFKIHNEDKPYIKHILHTYFNITPETVFQDLSGFSQSNKRSNKINIPIIKHDTCFSDGRDLYRQEDFLSAEKIFNDTINCLSKTEKKCSILLNKHTNKKCIENIDKILLETYYFKGLIANKKNNHQLAYHYFNKALDHLKKISQSK